ncbi:MAG: homoserine O-succinyltransferase [Christensenellaceae bacterium]
MPIIIPKDIPAFSVLKEENIFVMESVRAVTQDIRPIEIAVVNLMPTKIETETQLLRLLSNSPLQINTTFIKTATHESKNAPKSHLDKFYKTFDEVKNTHFDGMIITGAPVETLDFDKVDYWKELTTIMDYAKEFVTSTLFICWGAQAGLYYHYGIDKVLLKEKLFGVFSHRRVKVGDPLLKGADDVFYIPHSRHTQIDERALKKCEELEVLANSRIAGPSIIKSKDGRQIFILGHCEYDRDTLKNEYLRDIGKGLNIKKPVNYFSNDKTLEVNMKWAGFANILYTNWLNYYVYQVTPYKF